MDLWIDKLIALLPALLVLIGVIATLSILNYVLRRKLKGELGVSAQIFMLFATAAGVLLVIFSLPITEVSRGQLLSLLGIVMTAVIALSSTTFVANIMAGLMLRAVNSFRPGDFIRCQDFFGRVTERGLFHTEIQTEDRDLATMPNLFLVTNPLTVVHGSGTIISANLSLGYDLSHVMVEELLKDAAEKTGLEDAFVLVGELGDFSVSYRVGGFSEDVNRLLTTKSNLRKNILAVLHARGVEIVSPNFMNQRVLEEGQRIIPKPYREETPEEVNASPEEVIFDKADTAAEKEALRSELGLIEKRLAELDESMKTDKTGKAEGERDTLQRRAGTIARELAERDKQAEGEKE